MKILLIRPKAERLVNTERPPQIMRAEGVFPPLGLAYVAAALEKAGHSTSILDCEASKLLFEDISLKIREARPDIVGVTCTTPELHNATELCRLAKKTDDTISTVLGGAHMSCFPKETVGIKCMDFGVIGEGELTFVELAEELAKTNRNFRQIQGLVWKRDKKVVQNHIRKPLENIDGLPLPARHLLPLEKYHAFLMRHPMTAIIGSRGCPYHCAYCFRDANTSRYRNRSPNGIADELEECITRYGIHDFAFLDDCWPKPKLMDELCREITTRGLDIRWNIRQRTDLVNAELLRKMKKAGCSFIKYGVESGSDRILKMMKKGATTKKVEDAFSATRKTGMQTFGYFMFGYPTETEEDFKTTLELAKKIDPDWAMFNTTVPFPNTELLRLAIKQCGFDAKYWPEWSQGKTTRRMPTLSRDAADRCLRAYREFYFRPAFIGRAIRNLRNFKELKKYAEGAYAIICAKQNTNKKTTDRHIT